MGDIVFFCTSCGHESGKWLGQCPGCGEWNSYAEQPAVPKKKKKAAARPRRGARAVPVTEAAATPIERLETGLQTSTGCSAEVWFRDPFCCSPANPGSARAPSSSR